MSDLTTFRDHCRKMQTAEHKPECPSLRAPGWVVPTPGYSGRMWMGLMPWTPPACDGCNPLGDRELFARLADEVDAYLHPDEVVDLFGETAVEPESEVPC